MYVSMERKDDWLLSALSAIQLTMGLKETCDYDDEGDDDEENHVDDDSRTGGS